MCPGQEHKSHPGLLTADTEMTSKSPVMVFVCSAGVVRKKRIEGENISS